MELLRNKNDSPMVYLLGKTFLNNTKSFYIQNDPIMNIAAGDRHAIIITERGRIFAFGANDAGQLGLGHTNSTDEISLIKQLDFSDSEEKVILAACGQESSLVATDHGSLYGFGSNNRCQLGIDLVESRIIYPFPVQIEYFDSNIFWKQIEMGAEHTCALTSDGKVYVWGSNEDGQCGQTRKQNVIRVPIQLQLQSPVTFISCGYYHTGLIVEEGRLFLFGSNRDKQLGRSIPDQYDYPLKVSLLGHIRAVACGNQHTVVLTDTGEIYTCGRGDYGQLGLGLRVSIAENFKKIDKISKYMTNISSGKAHTVIYDLHGELYVFGNGKYGKLGFETNDNKFEPSLIDKFKRYDILKVVCGGCQTLVLAQKKQIEVDEEDMPNTVNLNTEYIKNLQPRSRSLSMTNYMSRTDHFMDPSNHHMRDLEWSTDSKPLNNFLICTRSNSDSDDSSTVIQSSSMNIKYENANKKTQLSSSKKNDEDITDFKSDRLIPCITITDHLTKSSHNFSSLDDSRSDHTSLNDHFINEMNSIDKTSILDEQSHSKSKADCETRSLHETDIHIREHLSPKLLLEYAQQASDGKGSISSTSTTASSTTSSSASSTEYQNIIVSAAALYGCATSSNLPTIEIHEKLTIANSTVKSCEKKITIEPQQRILSRILRNNSSKVPAKTTHKSSRTCLII